MRFGEVTATRGRTPPELATDSAARLRALRWGLGALFLLLAAALVCDERRQGAAYRDAAARTWRREHVVQARRGRLLSRDGVVLAHDEPRLGLAVDYRYLAELVDETWLRRTLRKTLSRAEARDPAVFAQARRDWLARRDAMLERLAALATIDADDWSARVARVQRRVVRISERVNRGAAPGVHIVVAEEIEPHLLADSISLEAAAEIQSRPEQFPGVRIVETLERVYPHDRLAAQIVGYVAAGRNGAMQQSIGRAGMEQACERSLRGTAGQEIEPFAGDGTPLPRYLNREPRAGSDVTLSIDAALQQACEGMLDEALEDVRASHATKAAPASAGGSIVVIDIRSGELLAMASAPRFRPQAFADGDNAAIRAALDDPGLPMLDRATQAALPPGSVFKLLTALALVGERAVTGDETCECLGYLDVPNRRRCAIFAREGHGHGPVQLASALATSCNVFFFDRSARLAPETFLDWVRRAGFGAGTECGLPGEVAGHVPTREELGPAWQAAEEVELLAVGQGRLTATPLEVARFMATIGGGGRLVQPRLIVRGAADAGDEGGLDSSRFEVSPQVFSPALLIELRRGMLQATGQPGGTAYAAFFDSGERVAGKTGTAQAGGGQVDHAWFAGYVPAESPRVAVVVLLEHGGDASERAAPLARRVIDAAVRRF